MSSFLLVFTSFNTGPAWWVCNIGIIVDNASSRSNNVAFGIGGVDNIVDDVLEVGKAVDVEVGVGVDDTDAQSVSVETGIDGDERDDESDCNCKWDEGLSNDEQDFSDAIGAIDLPLSIPVYADVDEVGTVVDKEVDNED
jgi:hypothetical protein